ncbi:MAG: aminoacyl-histidine dipeptidase [Bacteroidales bacterium]|jgi:dipeptidase D|nr:aminoacyl-histidine dipeptidase [Bacteroidales bacterium]
MSEEIRKLKPEALWENFYQLTQIPRPSKHEDAIQAFMMQWGKDQGLETRKDEVGNIIIKKPATAGMEDRKGVILQAHLDMVPQKNSGTDHNFETDPIDAYIDGDWVKARGTTLGADNGIGAAAAMAVLQNTEMAHGPVEALFTSDEETGMTGANGLKPGLLDGDILINMDSEDEGELYIGCAGGVDTVGVFKYTEEDVFKSAVAFKISITGLKGGHSGLDIHLGRGNANKIMNGLLMEASDKFGLRLSSIEGGSLRNAIPRESFALVAVPEESKDDFLGFVSAYAVAQQDAFKDADPGLEIMAETTDVPASLIDAKTTDGLYQAVENCPNGVIAMDKNMPDVVETSTNLAVVKSKDGKIEMASLQRSAVDDEKTKVAKAIYDVFTKAGAQAQHMGDYPGWKPNVDSPILNEMKEVYNNKFGRVPEVKVIHAGLECGILGAAYPHWDMISFGPTIRNPHSPDEMVNVPTVAMFWEYLVETLKNIPAK